MGCMDVLPVLHIDVRDTVQKKCTGVDLFLCLVQTGADLLNVGRDDLVRDSVDGGHVLQIFDIRGSSDAFLQFGHEIVHRSVRDVLRLQHDDHRAVSHRGVEAPFYDVFCLQGFVVDRRPFSDLIVHHAVDL